MSRSLPDNLIEGASDMNAYDAWYPAPIVERSSTLASDRPVLELGIGLVRSRFRSRRRE